MEEVIKYYENYFNESLKQDEEVDLTKFDRLKVKSNYFHLLKNYKLNSFEVNFLSCGLRLPNRSLYETYIDYNNSLEKSLRDDYFQIGLFGGSYILIEKKIGTIHSFDTDIHKKEDLPIQIANSIEELILILGYIMRAKNNREKIDIELMLSSLGFNSKKTSIDFWRDFIDTMN